MRDTSQLQILIHPNESLRIIWYLPTVLEKETVYPDTSKASRLVAIVLCEKKDVGEPGEKENYLVDKVIIPHSSAFTEAAAVFSSYY